MTSIKRAILGTPETLDIQRSKRFFFKSEAQEEAARLKKKGFVIRGILPSRRFRSIGGGKTETRTSAYVVEFGRPLPKGKKKR